MGEHGPHAILHGPDGWLYVVNGNHAWAQGGQAGGQFSADALAERPDGAGPGQARLDRGRAAAAAQRRQRPRRQHPGARRLRLAARPRRQEPGLVAAGFRNAVRRRLQPRTASCSPSTATWNGTRTCRGIGRCASATARPAPTSCWRTGSANTPAYYIDSLPAIYDVGRGSPVGMEFYDHTAFPPKYHGAYFMADWSLGIIYAAHLKPRRGDLQTGSRKVLHRRADERDRHRRRPGRLRLLHDGRPAHAGRRLPHRLRRRATRRKRRRRPPESCCPGRSRRPHGAGRRWRSGSRTRKSIWRRNCCPSSPTRRGRPRTGSRR